MRSNLLRRSVAAATGAAIIGAMTLVAVPAHASEPVSEAEQVLEEVVPELLEHTDPSTPLDVVIERDAAHVTVSDDISSSQGVDSVVRQDDLTVSLIGEYDDAVSTESGLQVATATEETAAVVFQPMEGGFRAVSVTESADSPHAFSYEFDLPADAEYVTEEDGAISISSERLNGVIQAPWAFDAEGAEVPTWYEFDGLTLTQHVSPSAETVYPIVADPAWSYSLVYELKVSPSNAWSQLKTCFNCEFPITGAPKALPKLDQKLDLSVCFGPACGAFPVRVTGIGLKKTAGSLTLPATPWFKFVALDGHVEGKGSTIQFDIAPKGTKAQLKINAYIKNDFGPLNAVVKQAAGMTWQMFADNLNK